MYWVILFGDAVFNMSDWMILPSPAKDLGEKLLRFDVMLHGTIRNDAFSATQRCKAETMLKPFETMSQQYCNAVLR